MLRPRIIPVLLVHQGGLVKTVQFSQPKYVGDPINVVKIFNEKQVDELALFDIDASREKREPNFKLLSLLAAESRMPICYGGGVTSVKQARTIVSLGIEKVAVSSAAITNPNLVSEIASEVGSQSVVVVLDVKMRHSGYSILTHNGTIETGRTLLDLACHMEERGVGEIVVNSIDRDGMMQGYDTRMVRQLRDVVNVPITIVGGAGNLEHIAELVDEFHLIGAGAGSMFVFKGPYKAVLVNYPGQQARDEIVSRTFMPLSGKT